MAQPNVVALMDLYSEAVACTRCPRLASRPAIAGPQCGPPNALILFVGEAPGRRGADRTGEPFVGDRSGDNFLAGRRGRRKPRTIGPGAWAGVILGDASAGRSAGRGDLARAVWLGLHADAGLRL
jgi:hypothetical protein